MDETKSGNLKWTHVTMNFLNLRPLFLKMYTCKKRGVLASCRKWYLAAQAPTAEYTLQLIHLTASAVVWQPLTPPHLKLLLAAGAFYGPQSQIIEDHLVDLRVSQGGARSTPVCAAKSIIIRAQRTDPSIIE